ncbi:MAG: hypothetical protein DRP74_01110 [Candidatus Omnitrophota bacterium]|nr:MAG: hypothetical protein DRP74_01110 [Candidatus Omnitrophota bacterium]
MLRKIRERLKSISQKDKNASLSDVNKKPVSKSITEKLFGRKTAKKETAKPKEEILGTQETIVRKTKFYTGQITKAVRMMPQELPIGYGVNRIIIQVRDPRWIHSYWEVTSDTWNRLRDELCDEFYKAKRVLRVYDVSYIVFDGSNANSFFDVEINDYSNNWYVDTQGPGKSWCVDLGLLLPGGRFITIVRSNTVTTPIEGPCWITDEEWMIPEEMFARLYGIGFGLGRSSPIGKAWQERIKRQLFSGALASPSSPMQKPKERKFWLVVNTELIVYGATEPDAAVFVQDKPIQLRPDGTFTLRFALPNGKQVIPVKAISADKEEERKITPIVNKETK